MSGFLQNICKNVKKTLDFLRVERYNHLRDTDD